MSIEQKIRDIVTSNDIVLFMKGTRGAPQCGFSASVVDVLSDYVDAFTDVDVLADPELREGVKQFSSWPTIPQLYVRGEFVGGADIVRDMATSGELATLLGRPARDATPPDVKLTKAALDALSGFVENGEQPVVRMKVSAGFQYGLDFDQEQKGDVIVRGEGYTLLFDRPSSRRVDGTVIDYVERPDGGGFKIDNPNEPPKVRSMTVQELDARMKANGPFSLFDVRTEQERGIARIPQSIWLDDAGKAILEDLDRDAMVVMHCHHGVRSRAAAEHALRMGFRNVYNLEGGIDAWSIDVDASVPRY